MRAGLVAALLFVPLTSLAGGDAQAEQDAAAVGRGGAGTAALMGASSVHYNPANLSRLFGIDGAVGVGAFVPGAGWAGHLYGGYGNGRFGFAAGLNVPFDARFEAADQGLRVLAGHLGGAYQLGPRLSVGATLSAYRGSLEDGEGTARLQADGFGVGGGVGLSWAPAEWLRIGAAGTLPVEVALQGSAGLPSPSTLRLPGRLAAGAALYLGGTRVFLDLDYRLWSGAAGPEANDLRRDRTFAFGARAGVEHELRSRIVLRAGALFEQGTSASVSERVGATLGAGKDLGPIRGDLAYLFVMRLPRAEATHLAVLTLRFGTPAGIASKSADTSSNEALLQRVQTSSGGTSGPETAP